MGVTNTKFRGRGGKIGWRDLYRELQLVLFYF